MTLLGGIFSSSSFSFQRESAGLLKFEFLDIWKNLISFSHFNDIMAEHRNLDLNFFSFTKLKISSNVFFHPTLLMTHLMPNLIRITLNSLLLNLSGGCSSLSLSLQLLAYWLYWLMKVLNFDYFCTLPFIFVVCLSYSVVGGPFQSEDLYVSSTIRNSILLFLQILPLFYSHYSLLGRSYDLQNFLPCLKFLSFSRLVLHP